MLPLQSSSTTMMADFVSIFMTKDSRQIEGKAYLELIDHVNVKCSLCKLMLADSDILQRGHNYDIKMIPCVPCSKMNVLYGH